MFTHLVKLNRGSTFKSLMSDITWDVGSLNDVEEEEILIPVGWKKIQAFEF